jgi:hypothetical protein
MIGDGHTKRTVGPDDHPTRLLRNCGQIAGSVIE